MKNKKEILDFLNKNIEKLSQNSIHESEVALLVLKNSDPKTLFFKVDSLRELLDRINIDDSVYLHLITNIINQRDKKATKSNIEKTKNIIKQKLKRLTKNNINKINKQICNNKIKYIGPRAVEFINSIIINNIHIETIDDEIYIEVKKTPKVYLMELDKSNLLFGKTIFNKIYKKEVVETISEEVFMVIALKFLKLNKICLKNEIDIADYVTNVGDIIELSEVAKMAVTYLLSSKLFLMDGIFDILLEGEDL